MIEHIASAVLLLACLWLVFVGFRCKHRWVYSTTLIDADVKVRKCTKCDRIEHLLNGDWLEWYDPPQLVWDYTLTDIRDWAKHEKLDIDVEEVSIDPAFHNTQLGKTYGEDDA